MVRPVSAPQPDASGRAASNAALVRQRWPLSGSVGRQPVARSMPAPDRPITRPWPPRFTRALKTAMLMSARPAMTGPASGPASAAVSARSASRNSRCRDPGTTFAAVPAAAARSASITRTASAPVSIAAALPRLRAWRTTIAPATAASLPVPSLEPSSTTTTMSTPGIRTAALTVAPIRSDSFLAGITTARPPRGDMAAILVAQLPADCLRRGVRHGEHRFKPRHLQDLPDR